MLTKFKLKHLDLITEKQIDYAKFMVELYGYKNTRFNKVKAFVRCFNKTKVLIDQIKNIDTKKVLLNPDCSIKPPNNIDSISFKAMMQIQMLCSNAGKEKVGELISELIAIVCFENNCYGEFDCDSFRYKNFKNRILNKPAFDMIGLYNCIDKQLQESTKKWNKLFLAVEVEDPDYLNAGGDRMGKFNVNNTIKAICTDYNVSYHKAWFMSYGVTQANSLGKATAAHVQHLMSKIKEQRMKNQRRS